MKTLMHAVKEAKGLQNKYPDDEIVRGIADKKWTKSSNRSDFVYVTVTCPFCHKDHRHGAGVDDGFPVAVIKRVPHCGDNQSRGHKQYIIIADLSKVY